VRETQGTAGGEALVELRTRSGAHGDAFERDDVERAASEAEAGLRAGLRVALRTTTPSSAPRRARSIVARLLGYLALVQPDPADAP